MKNFILVLLFLPLTILGQTQAQNYIKSTSYNSTYLGPIQFSGASFDGNIFTCSGTLSGGSSGSATITNNVLSINVSGSWLPACRLKLGVITSLATSPVLPDKELGAITVTGGGTTGYFARIKNGNLCFYSPYFLKGVETTLSVPYISAINYPSTDLGDIYTCSGGSGAGIGTLAIQNNVVTLHISGAWSELCNLKTGTIKDLVFSPAATITSLDLGVIKSNEGDDTAYRAKIENNQLKFYPSQTPPTATSSVNVQYSIDYSQKLASDGLNYDMQENITYIDGLGRPYQSIALKAGGQQQDIVSVITYDDMGRQAQQFLPYADPNQITSSADFRNINVTQLTNPINQRYLQKYPADLSSSTPNPYSQTFYDSSPLNRVLETAAPGIDWKGDPLSDADHTIKYAYNVNSNKEVRKFTVQFPLVGVLENIEDTQLTSTGYYAIGELYKTVMKNENWKLTDDKNNTTEEFRDIQGRIILKRTYNNNQPHDTYYVYDKYSNLSYVVPPAASDDVVNEVKTFPTLGKNYSWTSLSLVDQQLSDSYNKALSDYDNSDILSADLMDKYGGQGGFSLLADGNGNLVMNINITTSTSMPYRTGSIADLKDFGKFADKELGRIKGNGYSYIFSIKSNMLYVSGDSGKVPSLNASFTGGQKLDYSQNYAWTSIVDGDPQIEKDYDTAIAGLNNTDILTTYTANPYGAQGGVGISLDANDNLTLSLNITATTPLKLQNGATIPLNISRKITDGEIGTVTGTGFSYTFSILANSLVVVGNGFFNNLSLVAIKGKGDISYNIQQEVVDGLCYIYHYDYRKRKIEKHIPDKGWTYMVYDNLSRLIFTQDQSQRLTNNWLFTKYDLFNRVAYTGQFTNTFVRSDQQLYTRKDLQTYVQGFTNINEARTTTTFSNSGVAVSYTHTVFPDPVTVSGAELFTVNYYDDYNFDLAGITIPGSIFYGTSLTTARKTLPTGNKIRVLGTTNWTTTLCGYNDKAMPIWNWTKNPFLGTDNIIESNLDFLGKPIQTRSQHINGTTLVLYDNYIYDLAGRLLKQWQIINGNAQLIAYNNYDELGELKEKKVGGTFNSAATYATTTALQTINYSYNIRGWLKGINDSSQPLATTGKLFAFGLNYNTPALGATAQYNGNISETNWRSRTDDNKRAYKYAYDNLNRLTDANYIGSYPLVQNTSQTENYTEGVISYDKNGNIQHLERYGLKASGNLIDKIDMLTYNYVSYSNKLRGVSDAADLTAGFNNGTTGTSDDYTYDVNGNLTNDLNKAIGSITYNYLNLPVIVKKSQTDYVQYTYDAAGVKLKKVSNTAAFGATTTLYDHGFQYTNGVLDFFPQAEGYVKKDTNGSFSYIYQYKDNLGNIRLSYKDTDGNGIIAQNEVQEETNYYAFGLQHKGYNNSVVSTNKHKYNDKEFQDELNVNLYDYGARNYDPALGRFMNIDPLAEKYWSLTTYQYGGNNPVFFIDVNGEFIYINDTNGKKYRYENGQAQAEKDGKWTNIDSTCDVSDFVKNIIQGLSELENSGKTGKGLVDTFSKKGKDITFNKKSGNSKDHYTNGNAYIDDNSLESSFVKSNGGYKFEETPLFVAIGHELAHGLGTGEKEFMNTWYMLSTKESVSNDEKAASHYENMIRAESGLPLRGYYSAIFNPRTNIMSPDPKSRLIDKMGNSVYFKGMGSGGAPVPVSNSSIINSLKAEDGVIYRENYNYERNKN